MTCRAAALVLAVSSGLVGAAPAPAKPQRIMSMNMCTDMLLLELVPRSRIASVTYLAHDALAYTHPGADQGIPTNRGTAEDVVNYRPDLILAGDFSTPVTRRLAERVGARVVEMKSADTFADIRNVTRRIGDAVGERARAEALIADMDRKLARLAARPPERRYTVAAWSGGSVPGRRTLANEIIEAAGAVNLGSRLDSARFNTFDMEELLRADPDVIMHGRGAAEAPALRTLGMEHPLVRRIWEGRSLTYPEALYTCGLPASADAAVELRAGLDRIAAARRR